MIIFLKVIKYLRIGFMNPCWFLLGSLVRKVLIKTNLYTRHLIGGYGPFKLHSYFLFSDFSTWGNEHNDGFEICVGLAAKKKCFVDCGAHIGLVALPVLSVMDENATLLAVEASAVNSKFLKEHILENGFADRAIVETKLIGERMLPNQVFFESEIPSGLNNVTGAHGFDGVYKENKIEQVTLDYLCQTHSLEPELIKIDVEGSELNVLLGAEHIILSCRPKIVISIHPDDLARMGQKSSQIKELLASWNYEIFAPDGELVSKMGFGEYLALPRGT